MKKSKFITLLIFALCLTFSLTAFACAKKVEPEQVFGFDVEESITVDSGTNLLVDIPIVTDKNGNPLDVIYEVTTAKGGTVGLTANRFFAIDGAGYIINYAVITSDGVVHKKSTIVNVRGASNLYAEYDVMIDLGTETEIKPISNFENPEYTFSVTYKSTGEEVTVTNGKFIPTTLGFYTVNITATENDVKTEYSYEVYCREAMQDGEIETFTPEWEEVRTLCGMDTFGWEVTSTEETGVYDRFGREANYIKMVSSAQYGYFYINPRGDEDYYRQLAEEGYTHVSFWVYCDSDINHDIMSQLYPDKGAYTSNIGTITPGIWTEIKIRLVENHVDYAGSFASAVEYFKKQQTHILCFDNAPGWNSGGHESNMTIYISDVFAVKSENISLVENAVTEYEVGDAIDFNNIISLPDGVEVDYLMQFRGGRQFVEDGYVLKANGTYKLNVIPTPNISTMLSVTITVTDDVVANISDYQVERTNESLTVNFSDLNAILTKGEAPVTLKGYEVFRYGQKVEAESSSFTTQLDGAYTVEIEGEYSEGGIDYKTYKTVTVDVWSNETKNIVTYDSLMFAHSEYCGWNNWDPHPTYVTGNFEVHGESGRMLRIKKVGQTFLVPMLPMYSKGYYQMILNDNPNATVTLKYYIETENTTECSIRSYFDGYESKGIKRNQWIIDTVTLEKFVNDYDKIATGYEEVKYLMDNNITKTHSRSEEDFLFWFSGNSRNNLIYIPDIIITTEANSSSVTTNGNLQTGEDNDLVSLINVTLDGQNAKIVTTEVYYGGQWISLNSKTFAPEFGGEYTFRIYAVSGNSYKTIECTLNADGEALTHVEDESLYTITKTQTFSFNNFIKDGYGVKYTVERVIGSSLEKVDCTIENNVLSADNLDGYGNYKITVTLVADEESQFGLFDYRTLYINYIDENPEIITVGANTVKYGQLWNNWYTATTPYGTVTIADSLDENLVDKTGSYFKAEVKPRWSNDNDYVGIQILPLYNKAYYESLLESGLSYNLKFEFMLDVTFDYATALDSYWYTPFGASSAKQGASFNTWYDVSISLDTLLEHWDTFTTIEKRADGTRQFRDIIQIRINGGASHNQTVANLYLGNITLEAAGVVAKDVQLVDTANKTTIDLTSLYTLGEIENATATLVDVYGNETEVSNPTEFDVTSIKQGVYDLVLMSNGKDVFSASVDIYDSSEGMVWQEVDANTVNDSRVWQHGYVNIGATTFAQLTKDTAQVNVIRFGIVQTTEGNRNAFGIRLRAIHSKEYYEMMSQEYSAITFDVYVTGGGLNVEVFDDANNDGENDTERGVWHGNNAWRTYSIPISFLLTNWNTINDLTSNCGDGGPVSLIVYTYYGEDDKQVVNIGNFGSLGIPVDTETVGEVKLVETATTPTLNLLDYDTENKIDDSVVYTATFTQGNGRVVNFDDATNIDTTSIPQGVYTASVIRNGSTYLTAKIDIYTATDGMIWQEISEYSVNDSHVWKYTYNNVGSATFEALTKDSQNVNVLSFVTVTAGEGNTNGTGLRIRAIHSKEYYEMMSETYEAVTFDVYRTNGGDLNVGTGSAVDYTESSWHGNNVWKTYSLSIDWILANWDNLNDLTTSNIDNSSFIKTYYGTDGTTKVSIGNFGSTLKAN